MPSLLALLFWATRLLVYVSLGGLAGMTQDTGHPARGIFWEDLPSTGGVLLGLLISFVELYWLW